MYLASVFLGSAWMLEAYLPILVWYLWRRPEIRNLKESNPWYYRAWNFMWISHYFVFQVPAIIWPFTYLGSQTVNYFYILVNYWVGTVMGGVFAAIGSLLFIFAAATLDCNAAGALECPSI